MTPDDLMTMMREHGARRVVAKRLAANDNSKNQIYLGGDYSAIQIIPFGELCEDESADSGSRRARLKADISLRWLIEGGRAIQAKGANLILYPKYPEVRLSGMLRGVHVRSVSEVLGPRGGGRWLFLGITANEGVLAFVCGRDAPCARWAEDEVAKGRTTRIGIFNEFSGTQTAHEDIMSALGRIARLGWIDSKRLDPAGNLLPCNAPNCGGYTLEAELGVTPNSRAEPDYDGWEVKQFNVANLARPVGGSITLMTPEPDGGFYVRAGPMEFVRKYGYPDRNSVADRMNFGGVHKFGLRHKHTTLRMELAGWDIKGGRMTDLAGGIELHDPAGDLAARWSFEALLNHWRRKHAKAVYVPSNCEHDPRRYRYGSKVFAGVRTDFALLLNALANRRVFYDPGIKLIGMSGKPELKRRSQFRIAMKDLGTLYEESGWREIGANC